VEQNVAQILHSCRLFSTIEPASFQRLVAMARLVRFPARRLIFRDGDECPGVYVVGSGLVRVYKTGPGGKEHVLHMVGPGQSFAEVAAIGGFPCPASAESVAATVCTLLPLERFRAALREDHPLCIGMMVGLTQWVHHLVGLLEDVALRDAVGRLAHFLLNFPADPDGLVELPMLKRHLASHLNLSSETFSRSIRRLVTAGVIAEPKGSHLRIVDAEKLARVAEGRTSEDES